MCKTAWQWDYNLCDRQWRASSGQEWKINWKSKNKSHREEPWLPEEFMFNHRYRGLLNILNTPEEEMELSARIYGLPWWHTGRKSGLGVQSPALFPFFPNLSQVVGGHLFPYLSDSCTKLFLRTWGTAGVWGVPLQTKTVFEREDFIFTSQAALLFPSVVYPNCFNTKLMFKNWK